MGTLEPARTLYAANDVFIFHVQPRSSPVCLFRLSIAGKWSSLWGCQSVLCA